MAPPDLLFISLVAMVTVFALLTLLAGLLAAITRLFPVPRPSIGAAEIAAITVAAVSAVPGGRVLRIEEVR